MGDSTPEPSGASLISQYKTEREPDGRLMIKAASPLGPVLGCAIPAAFVAVAAMLIGAGGVTVLVLLFSAIVILTLLYNAARVWVCGQGTIQRGIAFGPRRRYPRPPQKATAVVLRREVWQSKRGSTDMLLVETGSNRRMKIMSVHNWVGHESRLASGGRGSLSRSGPIVPSAPEPLTKSVDTSLLWLTSEAVREFADLVHRELEAPLKFESNVTPFRPRGR